MHRNRNCELTTDLTDVIWARLEKYVSYGRVLYPAMVALNIMSIRRNLRSLEVDVSATFIPPWVRHRVRQP